VAGLPTVEAVSASAATSAATLLLGFGALSRHVARLAAVEAVSTASTAAASLLLGLLAVAGHVAGLSAVEAVLAAAATSAAIVSAALLAPADADLAAGDLSAVELLDGLLRMLLLVKIDKGKGALFSHKHIRSL
jgi:hypothetical protein